MARVVADPLTLIPPPDLVRRELLKAERLAARFRVLLEVSERIAEEPPGDAADEPTDREPAPATP